VNEIRIGDCLTIMKCMILGGTKVQTCITSPPYFGLRDYGTARWEGGDTACDHKQGRPGAGRADGIVDERGQRNRDGVGSMGGDCKNCGARRIDSQIGLEESPAAYVARLVEVFRLVRELLAEDGTLWLNLGDSYASAWACSRRNVIGNGSLENGKREARPDRLVEGLKEKDLIGIPWRVAFALQADGGYLRSDIIWAKPNPMPESVTDRPTKSHEYLFLLAKSADYFYDATSIAEPALTGGWSEQVPAGWDTGPGSNDSLVGRYVKPIVKRGDYGNAAGRNDGDRHPAGGWCDRPTRNKRSVWTVSTQPYSGAHFATFPPELILPCVLACSRPGDVVFDPFMGSGTTALVAKENGRRYLGCELNPEYRALQDERLAQEVLFGPEVKA
jgi:DNA modification methylase